MRATELVYAHTGIDTPLVVVAVMDRSLSQIEIKQERLGLDTVGVTVPQVSCAELASSVGARGVDVDDIDGLESALAAAWSSNGPTLIGVHLDPASSREFFEVLRG
jgi:thiamine pyrophosphate-dependent acetolactate synthase large subunit-like protein